VCVCVCVCVCARVCVCVCVSRRAHLSVLSYQHAIHPKEIYSMQVHDSPIVKVWPNASTPTPCFFHLLFNFS
jgi:hypothetical protein